MWGIMQGLNLTTAITGTALAAAQTIPYFAEGGIMDNTGVAVMGDAWKHELAISPDGKMFISENKPTLYNLEKGTTIFPDINKLDLMSVLNATKGLNIYSDNKDMVNELKSIKFAIKNQKQGNFYGMPLIKQLNQSQRYGNRTRSLMN